MRAASWSVVPLAAALAACVATACGATEAREPRRAVARGAADSVPDVSSEPPPEPPRPTPPARAALTPVTLDTHVDTPQRMLDDGIDIAMQSADGHLDLPRMREGGLTGAFFSIWVDPRTNVGEAAWARARALVRAVQELVERHPDQVAMCTTADEVRRANETGRVAILMGVEGAHALGDAPDDVLLERLRTLFGDGARYMTVTWTNDNRFGHASTGAHPERGLTPLGRRLVSEMNRLGMIVDVSHVSDRTALDVLDVTMRPVLASHSSARALADHPRNVSDVLVRRIAAGGGAVCVNYFPRFIDVAYGARMRALEREGRTDPTVARPTVDVLAGHFAHIAGIGGAGAVCLGSDFDGIGELPEGMRDVRDLPRLFDALARRGLDVAAIRGGNVLRVLEAQRATPPAP